MEKEQQKNHFWNECVSLNFPENIIDGRSLKIMRQTFQVFFVVLLMFFTWTPPPVKRKGDFENFKILWLLYFILFLFLFFFPSPLSFWICSNFVARCIWYFCFCCVIILYLTVFCKFNIFIFMRIYHQASGLSMSPS